MVQISIHALRNLNHGGRSFPHSGFLGLTKLLVEGVVRTRVDDDHKLMNASSITISIKCYEARTKLTHSRINTLVDATTTLWSSPVHECTDIGDMELPFRITLPASVSGYSNLSFPEYKVFWRLEAAINHPPHFGLGVRQMRFYDLNLTRYDVQDPPTSPFLLRPSPIPGYQLCSSSSRIPPFYYRIDDPEHAVGPGDELPVVVNFIFDNRNPRLQIQSMAVVLERRLDLFEASGSPTPPEILTGGNTYPYSNSSEASSTASLTTSMITNRSSTYTQISRKRSASPPSILVLPSKSISGSIASAHSSEFHSSSPEQLSGVVRLSLPAKPPPSQWPVGESLKTDLAHIRFELRVKVTILSASGPVDVTLEPMEIRLAPISQEQRSIAREKIVKKKAAHSKSAPSSRRTSPSPSTSGSSKAGPDTPPPIPTPGPSPLDMMTTFDNKFPLSSLAPVEDGDRLGSTEWKHRVAGKRRAQSAALALSIPPIRQRTGSSALKGGASTSSAGATSGSESASTPAKSHGVTTPTMNLKHMPSQAVRAWEEELERISTRSKRKSDDMLSGGGSGSASDVEKSTRSIRGTRTRRVTVNAMSPPPSAYVFASRHPPVAG